MFKIVGKWLSRISLGALIREVSLDVDTVNKKDGHYLRIIVTAFDFKLLDEYIKLAGTPSKSKNKVMHLEQPVDAYRSNALDHLTDVKLKKIDLDD